MSNDWIDSLSTAILDALPTEVAIVDPAGLIRHVNSAWKRFAADNGGTPETCFAGVNYLETCDRSAERGDEIARSVAAGLRSVLSGELNVFRCEYPCHSPERQMWFQLLISPVRGKRFQGAVVQHVDRTGWIRVLLEELEVRNQKVLELLAERESWSKPGPPTDVRLLRERDPEALQRLRTHYHELVREALAASAFATSALSLGREEFLQELCGLNVTAGEVVRLHTEVVGQLRRGVEAHHSVALHNETRLLLLRVLAELADRYRLRANAPGWRGASA